MTFTRRGKGIKMRYYKLEIITAGVIEHEVVNFLYKSHTNIWLAKNGFERVSGNSNLFRGMDNTKYAKGTFVEVKLEDALITTELI